VGHPSRAARLALLLGLALVVTSAPAYAAQGQWERAWGQDVGGSGVEICTTAASCQVGTVSLIGGSVTGGQGVAVDADGDVWVAPAGNNRIEKFTAGGDFLMAVGKGVDGGAGDVCAVAAQCQEGAHDTEAGAAFLDPMGLATDAAGHVYVADGFANRVTEFSSAGAFVRSWGDGVGGNGFSVCQTETACSYGESSTGAGGFGAPAAVAVDDAGHVYVAEQAGNRVQRFATTAGGVTFELMWGKDVSSAPGTGAETCTAPAPCQGAARGDRGGELYQLTGIAVRDGHVYVLDSGNDRVQVFGTDGTWERAWGKDVVDDGDDSTGFEVCTDAAQCQAGAVGSAPGELDLGGSYGGIAVGPAGDVYVSDTRNDRVNVYAPDGSFLRSFGTSGTTGGRLSRPFGVAAGAEQQVYVVDQFNARVQKFRDSSAGPATFSFSAATYSHPEVSNLEEIEVTRGGDLSSSVHVDYATIAGGTATAGADYTTASGTLTFAPGETSKTFMLFFADDQDAEPDETVSLALSNPSFGDTLGAHGTAVLTIVDDDALNTTITTGPTGPTNDPTPTYEFTSNNPSATFQCRIDSQAEVSFTTCTSPVTVSPALMEGDHWFDVRAVLDDPVTQVDPTPAEAFFTVDTTPPTTTLGAQPKPGAGTLVSPGVFTGTVVVAATVIDAHLGQTRCAVDGSPPASFEAMAATPCPVEVSAPGAHTVYAASRDAVGNDGPVVSVSFRVLAVPDTIIDSGPSGTTYLKTPYFGFHATIAGSRFECRLDGAAYAGCTNPYLSATLSPGAHSFDVRAVSPDGTPDPTPAHRDFTLGSTGGSSADCYIKPFLDPGTLDFVAPPDGCVISAHNNVGEELDGRCSGRWVKCVDKNLDCPQFTVCTVTVRTNWYDVDHGPTWVGFASAEVVGRDPNLPHSATCSTGPTGDRCEVTETVTHIVVPSENFTIPTGSVFAYCSAYRPPHDSGQLSNDTSIRRLECRASSRFEPVSALQAVASGSSITLLVPGAGSVVVGPGNTPHRGIAARGKPAFHTVTQQVAGEGVVTIKPKLAKKAKRKLKKGKKVKLKVLVTYRSADGTVASHISKVVLQKPKKGPKPPKALISQVTVPRLF
jgi:hypothetical protein